LVYFRRILRQLRKNLNTQKDEYLKLLILLLSYINYVSTYYSHQSFYLLRICIVFIIAAWLIFSKINAHYLFVIFNFLSLFLGPAGPIILSACYCIEKHCSSMNAYPLIMSMLAESAWWWMGNRYEYSGIDVMKSYIFCGEYIPYLNGLCLLIYLLSPYLLVFFLINYRLYFKST